MKNRFWTKIVAPCLLILGEGAFASESNERGYGSNESNGHVIQITLPTVLDDTGSRLQPSLASTNLTQPDISHTTQSFMAVTVPVSDLLKYHPFSPRAPPVSAT